MACFDRFRYVISVLILGSSLTSYIGRVNLSVVVSFVSNQNNNPSTTINKESNFSSDVCQVLQNNFTIKYENGSSFPSSPNNSEIFDWDETTQGHLLSAFFYAYVCIQIPAGLLSERFGPRLLTSSAIIATGVICLVTPFMVHYFWIFMASRVVMGFLQAMVFPGLFCLISRWIPPNERSIVIGSAYMGLSLGSIIGTSLSGYLCKNVSWKSAFYIPGIIITIFGIIYAILMNDYPKDHFLVSSKELKHIRRHIRPRLNSLVNVDSHRRNSDYLSPKPFPWRQVLSSKIVWAASFAKFTNALATSFVSSKAPSYLEKVLKVDVDLAGYYISAIFAVGAVFSLLAGFLADITLRYGLNRTLVRKVFQSVGTFSVSICFFLLPLTECNSIAFVSILLIQSGTGSFSIGGEACISADLTNDHTATLFAFTNMISMISAISPQVYGVILDSNSTMIRHTWGRIFYFIGASNVVGGVLFCVFVSAEQQNWNHEDTKMMDHQNSRTNRKRNAIEQLTM